MKETGRRHSELKRKAEEAHTRTSLQKRVHSSCHKAQDVLNNGLLCLSTLVKETAGALTHSRVALIGNPMKQDTSKKRWTWSEIGYLAAPDDPRKVTTARKPRKSFVWKGRNETSG